MRARARRGGDKGGMGKEHEIGNRVSRSGDVSFRDASSDRARARLESTKAGHEDTRYVVGSSGFEGTAIQRRWHMRRKLVNLKIVNRNI